MPEEVRGYIFSREFMGERIPQSVQNLLVRDFCKNNNLKFNLHAVEYAMPENFLILESCIKELDYLDGIVAYSLFQMPENDYRRIKYFKNIIKKNKKIYFALENLLLEDMSSLERINEIWLIKKMLPYCPDKI